MPPITNKGKVINDSKTVRFENLFYLEKITTTLKLEDSNSSIPLEIIDNTGVTADITLTPDASEYVVNITNGDADNDYQIARTEITWFNYRQPEKTLPSMLKARGRLDFLRVKYSKKDV